MSTTTFLLLALATWRLSSLLANETGPFLVFKRIRRRAKQWCRKYRWCRQLHLYEGLECEWCNSMWVGTAFTLAFWPWLHTSVPETLVLPFALSTVTILVKYSLERIRLPEVK